MIAVLRNRSFFWLWMGQTVSLVGDNVREWAMIYWIFNASDKNPVVVSLSFVAAMLPNLVLGPIAGVWVDRLDRKRTMIVSDLVRGLLSLLLIAAVASGQYWYALAVSFLASCAAQFFGPARGAMVRRTVGKEHLLQANSLSQTTNSILQLAGPAMGTAIFTFLGPFVAFSLDAATYFISAICIALVGTSGAVEAAGEKQDFVKELKAGLTFCWTNSTLRTIVVAAAILMMGAGAMNALGIFMVREVLGLPEESLGYAFSAQPAASLVTAVLIGAAARKLRRAPLLVAVGMGLAMFGIGAVAWAQGMFLLVVGILLVGVANVVLNLGLSTTMQAIVPDSLMGRVGSVLVVPGMAAMLLSAGAAGALALTISPRYILTFSAVMMGLAALYAFAGLRNTTVGETAAPPNAAEATA